MAGEHPVRVLHVDDDEDVLSLTASFLERDDRLVVETATSAREALDRLDGGTFDCIVSDYDMPRMDGLAFLTAVRDRGLDVPFILFTGHGNESVASEAVSAGVSDYLQKGTGTEQYEVLANRIRNYAGQYRTEREIERVRERHELVARAASDVIFEWDGDDDHLVFSGFADQFGAEPPADPDAAWWLESIHPEDREAVRDRLDEAVADREVEATIEYRFAPDGDDYRYVTEDRHHIFDDDGTVTRVVGAFRDVTARRRREQRLDALHEASRDLVTAETVDEVVAAVSRAAEEILELPIHAVYRRDDDELVPVAHTERAAAVFDTVPTIERGEGLMWDVVESGEPQAHADVTEADGIYNPDTVIRSEFYVPIADFGLFVAASTVPDEIDDGDVTLVKVLVANAEAALERVRS